MEVPNHPGSGVNWNDIADLKVYGLPDTALNGPGQLYHLKSDPGETTNLYSQHPETVKELKQLLNQAVASGRSRP